jgi:hypothetical protein
MSNYQLPGLRQESKDWLISVTDPFHDFEHPIEGAPDKVIGKSFTRHFTQTATVGTTADDDKISVFFYGLHGATDCMYQWWGVDGYCDGSDSTKVHAVPPIAVLRSNSVRVPCLYNYVDGNADLVGSFYTCQNDYIPSRLVSIGLEVVDTTPTLYKKGTIHVNHMTGVREDVNLARESADVVPAHMFNAAFRKPIVPTDPSALVQLPGNYTNAAAKGAYVVGRLNAICKPARGFWTANNEQPTGMNSPYPILGEYYLEDEQMYVPDILGGTTWQRSLPTWRDSGFNPFAIMLTGLSEQSSFQITVRTTVEYFPQVTHLMECGLATFSPVFEPEAFRIYHEIMRQIPAAVPVNFNAGGDFWRMLVAAARRVVQGARTMAPAIGAALSAAGTVTGNPLLGLAGQAVSLVPPPRPKRPVPAVGKSKRR